MPNVYSHRHQLDEAIFNFWGGIFHFYSNFERIFCRQTLVNLIRRRVFAATDLILHFLPMSHKKDAMHIVLFQMKQHNGISSSFDYFML